MQHSVVHSTSKPFICGCYFTGRPYFQSKEGNEGTEGKDDEIIVMFTMLVFMCGK